MNHHERKLIEHMEERSLNAEHLAFEQPCHSVAEAAGVTAWDFVKSICLVDGEGNLILLTFKGRAPGQHVAGRQVSGD